VLAAFVYSPDKTAKDINNSHRNTGAITSVIVANIFMRTWIEGPAVSLNGSPTLQMQNKCHNLIIINSLDSEIKIPTSDFYPSLHLFPTLE